MATSFTRAHVYRVYNAQAIKLTVGEGEGEGEERKKNVASHYLSLPFIEFLSPEEFVSLCPHTADKTLKVTWR